VQANNKRVSKELEASQAAKLKTTADVLDPIAGVEM